LRAAPAVTPPVIIMKIITQAHVCLLIIVTSGLFTGRLPRARHSPRCRCSMHQGGQKVTQAGPAWALGINVAKPGQIVTEGAPAESYVLLSSPAGWVLLGAAKGRPAAVGNPCSVRRLICLHHATMRGD
jgi:hypothetical protein